MYILYFTGVHPAYIRKLKSRNEDFSSDSSSLSSAYETVLVAPSQRGKSNDTTVYTVAAVGYRNKVEKKKRRFGINTVTKTNRGTLTDDTTNFVNRGTMTSTIWNPVLDRRDKSTALVKDRALMVRSRLKKRETKSQSVSTDGRMVTFRNSTQIIPRGPETCHHFAVGKIHFLYRISAMFVLSIYLISRWRNFIK